MKKNIEQNIIKLFEESTGDQLVRTELIPPSGSYRQYIRLIGKKQTVMGVYNADKKENKAFITFSRHFKSKDLPVPSILAVDESKDIYLQDDFGDTMLFDFIQKERKGNHFPDSLILILKKTIKELIRFQIEGGEGLDYSVAYPRAAFDKQSMMWDLNYFKYYFLKLAKVPFDEQLLEDDYLKFTDYLLQAPDDYFLYRDFQSRNVMLKDGEPKFIDYQGGRKGALPYDLASLLYDAKADFPQAVRDELLAYYLDELSSYKQVDIKAFKTYYYGYVLIRKMQAMGAFGFRGFYEKKVHFLQSIPYALRDLREILPHLDFSVEFPELLAALKRVCESEFLNSVGLVEENKLKVSIQSFSYRRGIQPDGFVFDCRIIDDPVGDIRFEESHMNSEFLPTFFKEETSMHAFLKSVCAVLDFAIDKSQKQKIKQLDIYFGCVGGQHRSVYAADYLAKYIEGKYDVQIELKHLEMGSVKTF
ncbi:phosphotransferase enzyme family protein [Ancylomarina salipaludis]|uniref:Phosphotransferase enzyme family protein n=1 Tax=Ancylomarina salipaludis TaxID=2501299 RepID=A0A4Q1JKL8_9BACT|nr:RNase adapter RapZ [Ancylomarina salipaludis]RXQ93897.1 phosphotransferase enzyme family protein [Ancylomarina salipaludis]